jgi:excisionase family DNA binding protein
MNTETLESRYLSYSQAARYLSISLGSMRRLVESGKVNSYKVGERLCRFDRQELDRMVRGKGEGEQ